MVKFLTVFEYFKIDVLFIYLLKNLVKFQSVYSKAKADE
ncbi:hypothetical protein J2Z64_000017 [Oceanobacillus polygoni]|uniref:Uncharacterized protein n=1 Tax=Oceanobacillus polygoni TaxID=1235259 RepID=A0A9X1CAF1_9BACI|nr:hypothetical protein [Oceanobacillus polygoni]